MRTRGIGISGLVTSWKIHVRRYGSLYHRDHAHRGVDPAKVTRLAVMPDPASPLPMALSGGSISGLSRESSILPPHPKVTRPMTAPVIAVAQLPAIQLFIPSPATSTRRDGDRVPMVDTSSPTLARFAKPHSA